jgi:hypothetical protein
MESFDALKYAATFCVIFFVLKFLDRTMADVFTLVFCWARDRAFDRKRVVNYFTIGAMLILSGCASTPTHHLALTGDIMVDGPRMITEGSPRDRVLWQYRTASAAMRHGQFDVAKPLLDDALLTLGGVYGKDAEARKARGLFVAVPSAEMSPTFLPST